MRAVWKRLVAGLVLAVVLIAAQCSPFGVRPEPELATPVELTYISFLDDDNDNAETKLIEQFEATYPQLTIARSQYQQPLSAYLDDQPAPDLMMATSDADMYAAIDAGLVMDISDLWLQSGLPESYLPGFRTLGKRNGKQYYLPVGYAWNAIYYNREIFSTYDLEPPQTWDEFLAVADTLAANGVTPLALAGRDLWATGMWFDYLNLRLNGPEFRDALVRGQERFDDLRVRDVFDRWRFLLDSGYFAERSYSRGQRETWRLVFSGEAAMILADPITLSDLPGQIRERLSFFPFPIIDPNVPIGEITPTFGYLIPANTAHPLEALEFMRFIGSPEVQSAMAGQFGPEVGVLPVYQDIDPETIPPEVRPGYDLAQQAIYFGQPYVFAVSAEIAQATTTAFSRFLEDPAQMDLILADLEEIRQAESGE